MATRLYTLHHKGSGEIRVIADRFDGFALALPPLRAVWHGLWITLAGQVLAVALAALRSPAGLDIGAVTPEEIALSVLAEIVQERRRAAPVGLVEDEVVQVAPIGAAPTGGVAVETRVVQPAAGGCRGDGEKH